MAYFIPVPILKIHDDEEGVIFVWTFIKILFYDVDNGVNNLFMFLIYLTYVA